MWWSLDWKIRSKDQSNKHYLLPKLWRILLSVRKQMLCRSDLYLFCYTLFKVVNLKIFNQFSVRIKEGNSPEPEAIRSISMLFACCLASISDQRCSWWVLWMRWRPPGSPQVLWHRIPHVPGSKTSQRYMHNIGNYW